MSVKVKLRLTLIKVREMQVKSSAAGRSFSHDILLLPQRTKQSSRLAFVNWWVLMLQSYY